MTDEELEKLTQEVSGQIEQVSGDPEKPLDKAEMKHKRILEARRRALDRIKSAKERGNIDSEAKSCMEYAVITEYAEKNPFIFALIRAGLATWVRF